MDGVTLQSVNGVVSIKNGGVGDAQVGSTVVVADIFRMPAIGTAIGEVVTTGGVRVVPTAGANSMGTVVNTAQRANTGPDAIVAVDASVEVSANAATADGTLTLRVNDVDTSLVVTITAGVVGRFVSAGGPVSIAPGDLYHWRLVSGTGGNVTYRGFTLFKRVKR